MDSQGTVKTLLRFISLPVSHVRMSVFNRPYNQEIRITNVCRFAASLGTRFIRTQVTPRVLSLVVTWSGIYPKYCGVRQRFQTSGETHNTLWHIRTCDGLSEQATQKVKRLYG